MKWIFLLFPAALVLSGCGTMEPTDGLGKSRSPTQALVRGEITADEYLGAVRQANEEARADDQFEVNKEPTRAYNTQTGRFEYVPEGTYQKWNEQTQRWEFTPLSD
jgi:hypothetical protein